MRGELEKCSLTKEGEVLEKSALECEDANGDRGC